MLINERVFVEEFIQYWNFGFYRTYCRKYSLTWILPATLGCASLLSCVFEFYCYIYSSFSERKSSNCFILGCKLFWIFNGDLFFCKPNFGIQGLSRFYWNSPLFCLFSCFWTPYGASKVSFRYKIMLVFCNLLHYT